MGLDAWRAESTTARWAQLSKVTEDEWSRFQGKGKRSKPADSFKAGAEYEVAAIAITGVDAGAWAVADEPSGEPHRRFQKSSKVPSGRMTQ